MDITKQRLENSSFSFTFGLPVQCRSTAVISGFGLFVVLKVSSKRLFIQFLKKLLTNVIISKIFKVQNVVRDVFYLNIYI